MPRLSAALRRRVTQRAQERCEYCQTPQAIVVEMEIDHIIPLSVGGRTVLDNLCLACIGCNAFKLDAEAAADPQTGRRVALFNPRAQDWTEHFAWSDDGTRIVGLTPSGRATVARLRMNRERVVVARRLWAEAGWHPT
jgi:hypothetical protein